MKKNIKYSGISAEDGGYVAGTFLPALVFSLPYYLPQKGWLEKRNNQARGWISCLSWGIRI